MFNGLTYVAESRRRLRSGYQQRLIVSKLARTRLIEPSVTDLAV